MMLRASVVADFETPVLQFTDTALDGQGNNVTVGVIVYPTKIQVFGSRERDELAQEVGLSEDTITHLTITWQKDYAGTGKNLCTVYVNGIPNVTFEYNVNSTFGNGVLQIGQDSTDTYLYMMRMYSRALEGTEVLANMLNAIINGVEFDRATVRDNNAIMTDTIQYALARDKFNCFVIASSLSLTTSKRRTSASVACFSNISSSIHFRVPRWSPITSSVALSQKPSKGFTIRRI